MRARFTVDEIAAAALRIVDDRGLNALSMRAVESPDVRLIPWFNIVFLTFLFVIAATIWRLWRNFRQARIDPVIEDFEEDVDAARNKVGGFFSRLFGRTKR